MLRKENVYQQYIDILSSSQLFNKIKSENMEHLLKCMNPIVRDYGKNEIAAVEGTKLDGIGIVLSGILNVSITGITGSRILLGVVEQGELFGETAAFAGKRKWPATVESQKESKVMYLLPDNIVEQCAHSCIWHRQLQKNMLEILSVKALNLTKRIEYMAIKGIRAKICTYLYSLYLKNERRTFQLPLKKYEMADLFNVERPSLSREMINLRARGIIDFSGNRITIIDIDKMKNIIDGNY